MFLILVELCSKVTQNSSYFLWITKCENISNVILITNNIYKIFAQS